MAAPIITPLPSPPSRQNSAGTFATQADLFMSALPAFGSQMNATARYVDEQAAAAAASAIKARDDGAAQAALSAQRAAAAAASAQTAAAQSNTAKTYSDSAKGFRDSAQSAAAAAQSAAGLPAMSGKAGLPLVVNAGGNGTEFSAKVRRYEVNLVSSTTVLDLSLSQVFIVDATQDRTISFSNLPAATSATTVTIDIRGGSKITWPDGIVWGNNAPAPVQGANWTTVVLLWVGDRWRGAAGLRG